MNPTTRGGSLVEVWFSLIEGQAIHSGTFGSVSELHAKIRLHQRLGTGPSYSAVVTKTPCACDGPIVWVERDAVGAETLTARRNRAGIS